MAIRISRAIEALRRLAVPTAHLSPEQRLRLAEERCATNRARTAGVMPMLVVIQLAMLVVFQPRPDGLYAAFRAGVFWIHATSLPATSTLMAAAWLAPGRKLRLGWLGDAVLILAVGIGLSLSINTHRLSPNLNGLIISLFASTLVVRATPLGAVVTYGGALAGLFAGVHAVQPDSELRMASLTTGVTAVLITFAFSRVLDASFVREIVQRETIARQQRELRAWNAELERRVEAQVTETLARADEVRALDAQLRWKVRERSRELARALRSAATREPLLAAGARFEQRFEIERCIGAGAMGDVYASRDHATGKRVALKILRRSQGISPDDLNRFMTEAAAAATVVHPAIVRTFHVDVAEGGQFYLVMELIDGRTLASELEGGCFDAAQTARLGAAVAGALAVAHAAGVVHRDIKPGNLMLTAEPPGVRVLDFGVSKLADAESATATYAGQVVGTPLYMAPEQILRAGEVTGACDVYALGQVLYEMLTGEPSFAGKTVGEVLRAQITDAPMSVRARAGADRVPDDLARLIAQCLEKPPSSRPSADALSAALGLLADALGAPPLERIGAPRHARDARGDSDGAAETVLASS